ncbi:MAG: translation initiation factor IF-3 [Parcubacteria group bacterium]|jgi:translation initiation factor IF-3|nr:translation initiation factor IF-3 [Parcubacteria group bacterium]|tara:strand:+ start:883 stop:1434 length:552 start_codon:yes stop_codon:yes gene_type:complete
MRISRKRTKYKKTPPKKYQTNQYIRSEQVRLIDETGENVGVTDTAKALAMAQDKGLDLVEVSPLAKPPVAKIVDYSKLKYQEEKERRKEKAKQKKVEVKGIRLSLRISEHDKEVRVRQANKFLSQDDKVKIEMILRGRERQHRDLAREIINKFISSVNELIPAAAESSVTIQGGKLSVVIAKK